MIDKYMHLDEDNLSNRVRVREHWYPWAVNGATWNQISTFPPISKAVITEVLFAHYFGLPQRPYDHSGFTIKPWSYMADWAQALTEPTFRRCFYIKLVRWVYRVLALRLMFHNMDTGVYESQICGRYQDLAFELMDHSSTLLGISAMEIDVDVVHQIVSWGMTPSRRRGIPLFLRTFGHWTPWVRRLHIAQAACNTKHYIREPMEVNNWKLQMCTCDRLPSTFILAPICPVCRLTSCRGHHLTTRVNREESEEQWIDINAPPHVRIILSSPFVHLPLLWSCNWSYSYIINSLDTRSS